MTKREFLKSTGAAAAGSLISHYAPAQTAAPPRTNWAGNLTYHAKALVKPTTLAELQQFVRETPKFRMLGSRHSFNAIADTTATQVSLEHFDSIDLNPAASAVTVGAGARYGTLAPVMDAKGFALHNLASLPHITVAGAITTATHGSGIKNKNLSSAVTALEFVTPNGDLQHVSREKNGADFDGLVVGLGSVGVITNVTLAMEPRYDMAQLVYRNLSMDQLEHNFDTIMDSGYSVSLFTNWQNNNINQVWIKSRVAPARHLPAAPEFYGAKAATHDMHPIDDHSAESCTPQMGVPGPWYERLPHFKMNFTPSSGQEIQSEYFVPREHAYHAIRAVEALRDKITPHLFITELRCIAADDLWMSMAYQRDSLAIHFTWKPETPEVNAVLPLIEAKLAPFAPRPHWGKVFTLAPSVLDSRYAKMPAFRSLIEQRDPTGKLRNEFIAHDIFGA